MAIRKEDYTNNSFTIYTVMELKLYPYLNQMIKKLYEASIKGVKIDLIIRGICCLIPNKAYSKNIRIIRIVDQFLEHARVFYFHNNGAENVYLSSADWMSRNLHRRIECAFPIEKPEFKQELIDILNIQLRDNTNARLINDKMENIKLQNAVDDEVKRAQRDIYTYLEKIELSKQSKN